MSLRTKREDHSLWRTWIERLDRVHRVGPTLLAYGVIEGTLGWQIP
jgi:hypothetical protein